MGQPSGIVQIATTGQGSDMEHISLIIGIIFVVIYSYERFNNPVSNRSSTTAVRYHVAAVAYTLSYLCIFFVLSRYPALIEPLLTSGEGAAETLKSFQNLPSALLVALLLTGFMQKIPILSQIDNWLRNQLQYLAAIPFEVRRLAKQLFMAEFIIDQDIQDKVYKRLREEGLICDDINLEDRTESYLLWNKASVLMYHLSQWSEQRKTSSYITTKLHDYKEIKSRYNQLSELAKSCLKLCAETNADPDENLAFAELTKTFQEQCRSLIKHQCEFISHGALKCIYTSQARRATLQEMGFQIPDDEDQTGLTANQMATLFVILVGGILTATILFGSKFGSERKFLYVMTVVVTMNMVAVASVVYTKGKWAMSNPESNGGRPVFYYLVIGVVAVLASIPISLFFKTIIEMTSGNLSFINAVSESWGSFVERSYPWKLSTFATALCLAWQLDTTKIGNLEYPKLRWAEGALQAIVAVIAAWATYQWLAQIRSPESIARIDLETLLFRSAFIGFAIGYTIPYWFKVSKGQHQHDEQVNNTVNVPQDQVVQKA
jgi:hypothetical protein